VTISILHANTSCHSSRLMSADKFDLNGCGFSVDRCPILHRYVERAKNIVALLKNYNVYNVFIYS